MAVKTKELTTDKNIEQMNKILVGTKLAKVKYEEAEDLLVLHFEDKHQVIMPMPSFLALAVAKETKKEEKVW